MLIERLDRTIWRLKQAREHIAGQILPTLPEEPWLTECGSPHQPPWQHSRNPRERADEEASQELLVALRDGDLHATGRLSTLQTSRWNTTSLGWELHSGHHSHIAPEQWRGGQMEWAFGTLTMGDGQFIDIHVPRFAVLVIWPGQRKADHPGLTVYRSPYLDLLDQAIAEWRITERNQPKKELLVDWFREQTVEGEPVSENLASAMATLVRLPASQRGGARRAGS